MGPDLLRELIRCQAAKPWQEAASRKIRLRIVVVSALLVASGPQVWSQGQIIFDNHVNNVVVAPVFGVDPSDPGLAQQGNPADGTPAGAQFYVGAPLGGPDFTAQLFAGPPHAAAQNLQPLSPQVVFRSDFAAGFVLSPNSTVTVPGVAVSRPAKAQLRAWTNRGGAITNWGQITADSGFPRGASWAFVTPPLGGAFQAPPNLVGLESFNLATGAVHGFSVKVNFQTNGSPVPPAYLADTGLPFGPCAAGLSYGWNFDHSIYARERDATNSPDARHDTFIEMQRAPASVWEIALPSGLYGVHIAAGDPTDLDGVYRIEAEGRLVLQGTPTASLRWIEGDALVEVSDGRLTISNGSGSFNNRLCFVEIARIDPPKLNIAGRGAAANGGLAFGFEGEAGFKYQIESSINLADWFPIGLAGQQRGMVFEFTDTDTHPPGRRFYRTRTLASAPALLIYSNGFDTAIGPEWSLTNRQVTPVGARHFLGPFGRTTLTLSLTSLPSHTKARISFDLFVIGSWDGNSSNNGPDTWELNLAGGPTLLHTTFLGAGLIPSLFQAYPGAYPGSSFPARTGATEIDTLGYGSGGDAVYQLSFTFTHSASAAQFNFVGGTTESISNESWGLANVTVWLADDPYD